MVRGAQLLQQHLGVNPGARRAFGARKQRQQLLQEAELLLDACSALQTGATVREPSCGRVPSALGVYLSEAILIRCGAQHQLLTQKSHFCWREEVRAKAARRSAAGGQLPVHRASSSWPLSGVPLQKLGSILDAEKQNSG